jgi:hypothetical protein
MGGASWFLANWSKIMPWVCISEVISELVWLPNVLVLCLQLCGNILKCYFNLSVFQKAGYCNWQCLMAFLSSHRQFLELYLKISHSCFLSHPSKFFLTIIILIYNIHSSYLPEKRDTKHSTSVLLFQEQEGLKRVILHCHRKEEEMINLITYILLNSYNVWQLFHHVWMIVWVKL